MPADEDGRCGQVFYYFFIEEDVMEKYYKLISLWAGVFALVLLPAAAAAQVPSSDISPDSLLSIDSNFVTTSRPVKVFPKPVRINFQDENTGMLQLANGNIIGTSDRGTQWWCQISTVSTAD